MKGSSVKSGLAMILIGLSSQAMAANFRIDCDNSQSFTLIDYTIPWAVQERFAYCKQCLLRNDRRKRIWRKRASFPRLYLDGLV